MKKIGDIMNEMGFRKDAPDSVKEAFIKNVIKNAIGVEVETPSEKKATVKKPTRSRSELFPQNKSEHEPLQLSFDFDQVLEKNKAKVS